MKKHCGASTSWKNAERVGACRPTGARAPHTGRAPAAVLPAWLLDAVTQATRNAPAPQRPGIGLHQAATRNYLALIPREVLEHLLQEAQPPTRA